MACASFTAATMAVPSLGSSSPLAFSFALPQIRSARMVALAVRASHAATPVPTPAEKPVAVAPAAEKPKTIVPDRGTKEREGMETVIVVGAGPAGCLIAHYLLRRGFKVHVFERRPQISKGEIDSGIFNPSDSRSYPILLSSRAIRAFEGAGLELPSSVLKKLVGSITHLPNGKKMITPYSNDPGIQTFVVSRNALVAFLQQSLVESQWSHNLHLHYGWELSAIDESKKKAILSPNYKYIRKTEGSLASDGEKSIEIEFDLLIGSDGVSSKVRSELFRLQEESTNSECAPRLTMEFTINPESYKTFYIPPSLAKASAFYSYHDRVQLWPAVNTLIVNVADGSFWGGSKHPGLINASSPTELESFFREREPELFNLLLQEDANFVENYWKQPVIPFGGAVILSRFHDGNVLLIGDAAHAMFPAYGTGCNAALEDCLVFDDILKELTPSGQGKIPLHIVAAEFTNRRLADSHAIVEMNSNSILFPRGVFGFLQAMLLRSLHNWFPRIFSPISYQLLGSNMPFSKIKAKKRKEDIFFYSLLVLVFCTIIFFFISCIIKLIS